MVPKYPYIRDKRLRDMCRALPCQCCGSTVGVTWAHSNQARHGHGRGIKARAQKVQRWETAHWLTVMLAVNSGLWPADVAVPVTKGV